jgi:mannose-6-phosphate isomerase
MIVSADPCAKIGIGFNLDISPDAMRAAALDGSIEQLIRWYPVVPGDFFYIPANTVHAIGAGVGLIETQQNSDITYRLFDYGRARELHLEQGVAVALGAPYPAALHRHLAPGEAAALVSGPYFRLDRIAGQPARATARRYGQDPVLVIPLEGNSMVSGTALEPGSCGVASNLGDIDFSASRLCLLAQPC